MSDAAYSGPILEERAPPPIEESDLYRLDGSWLYVQSEKSGLNVIDVSRPRQPRFLHQLPISGRAGELYVEGATAFVLLEEASPPCRLGKEFGTGLIATTSQLVAVERATSSPQISAPLCVPGQIVASRKIGNFVYVVTTYDVLNLTWAFSIDVSTPSELALEGSVVMEGSSSEVHVTEDAIYVAQIELETSSPTTRVRYVSLDSADGVLQERGSARVSGQPAGRFHMDAEGAVFRIVTRGQFWEGANLHVIDFADADRPRVLGSLTGIAPSEDLHATRFDGDRAYVVTYEPVVLRTDPLWVISLSDPSQPEVLGHLEIPGWSDYVFPRGEQLVAVGRGDQGGQVAVALFDVSHPSAPAELARVSFGAADASSEANTDFRAASLIDMAQSDGWVVVPYTDNSWNSAGCVPEHHVQLVELGADSLTLRGESSSHRGRVLRTVPVADGLYALGASEVTALDISNPDEPMIVASVDVSDDDVSGNGVSDDRDVDECLATPWVAQGALGDDVWDDEREAACRLGTGRRSGSGVALCSALVVMGLGWARRRCGPRVRA